MTELIEVRANGLSAGEAFVSELFVSVGQTVEPAAVLVGIELGKAAVEIEAPEAGRVARVLVAVNDAVKDGDLLVLLERTESVRSASAAAAPAPVVASAPSLERAPRTEGSATSGGHDTQLDFHASPWIRGLARERGLDLTQVEGTGRQGRILAEDLGRLAPATPASRAELGPPAPLLPQARLSPQSADESRPLSLLQRAVGRTVTQTWTQVPHVTQFDDTDITELEAFRVALNRERGKEALKLTLLPFVVKAAACALSAFPVFNASLSKDALILKSNIHVGFAVDTDEGLRVPVIHHADRLGLRQIAQEIARLADKARASKLTAADVENGSFTISNLGGAGGTAFTPIINAPELAILGLSKAAIKPVWDGNAFAPRLMLPLSLSYDHRVINGVAGARFVSHLGAVLADLRRALL
ncbi:MAG TPA: 2-oxo acid dehydrogenase subunit E2 [Polyangiaceae bacterium]|nr:2-oxo acid dehydrogenase subunit E2 [Polyangiaceae bacterium]